MPVQTERRRSGGRVWHSLVVFVVLGFLLLPLLATFLFSISTEWDRTILPEGYTLDAYANLFADDRFLSALGRSFAVALLTVAISLLIMVPTVFIVALYVPRLEKWLQTVVLLPFAMPGVVLAVGLIKIYSAPPLAISGTIWILIGVYFIIILPYVYQSTRNSLRSVNAAELMEAAEVLGAGKAAAFLRVILPNMLPGVLVAGLLSFSIVFGEFVLANMLVGGSYEVVQVYLYRMMAGDGHLSSAVIVTFFALVLILYALVLSIGARMSGKKQPSTSGKEEPA
ncbi:ABC transporter permease [Cohnella caldifontis]|uniref:ABC transporter permease n=1 Tax=Cohnella caldifontis TaxID=3027471 RepID=UPI0023EAAC4E|nr:ABC transporter permease subunit [Cohnella sp. YIM B05605]